MRARGYGIGGRRARFLVGLALTSLALGAAAGPADAFGPRPGKWRGTMGAPIKFRVAHHKVRSLRIDVSDCGVYKKDSIRIHNHKFHARWGPSTRPIDVNGEFTGAEQASLDWSVGYTANVTPTCLDHDEGDARWISP